MLLKSITRVQRFLAGAVRVLPGALVFAAMLLVTQAEAAAPRMCIPSASGVPGSSGPPNWWTPGQTTSTGDPNHLAYQPFDPRWRGAMSLDYGSGSISAVEYRALHTSAAGKQFILLSWQVKSVAQFGIDQTRLYAGFYSPASNKGALLTLQLKATSTGDDSNFPVGTPRARSTAELQPSSTPYFDAVLTTGTGADPASWTSPSATPTWLTDTLRVWVNAQSNPYNWTVELRVPLDADIANGIDLQADGFRMWNYAQIEALLRSDMPPAIVPFTWPRPDPGQPVLTYASFQDGINQRFPAAGTWGEFALVANPAADAGCSGIFLATDRIGTQGTPFDSQIKLNANNTFFAEPENRTTAPIGASVLSATFRLANWGSQVGDTGAASWTAPASLTNVPGAAVAAGAFGSITGQWNPSASDADICPFIGQSGAGGVAGRATCSNATPTRMLHQCILVKLQGPGLNFVRDSATRNMDFVKASRFEREAEISVVGLPGLAVGKRDVFMYVERRNMPREVTQSEEQDSDLAPSLNALRKRVSDEELAATVPTWVVHSYHDTGEKITLANKKFVVLQPQTAFGYFVDHDGPLQGWSDVIEGADRLREDLYQVAPPNNGAVRVKTIVQAVEAGETRVGDPWPPAAPPPEPVVQKWWMWLLLLVLILLGAIILIRRRSRP